MAKKNGSGATAGNGGEYDLGPIVERISSGKCRNIFLMLGAGVSTSAGIPDFRSPKTGLYANLARLNLPFPEAVFEINFFRRNPVPFYTLAHELYPGHFRPTPTHSFVKLLADHSLLHTCFTQNIDTLERRAGVPEYKIVEAHGSFATQRCIDCQSPYDDEKIRKAVMEKTIPRCEKCLGLVKPDIVFFGESLPPLFHQTTPFLRQADLLIIIGTSLTVYPFASLVDLVPDKCPRVFINMEPVSLVGRQRRDIVCLGKCDDIIRELCRELGWEKELDEAWEATKSSVIPREVPKTKEKEKAKLKDEVEKLTRRVEQSLVLDQPSFSAACPSCYPQYSTLAMATTDCQTLIYKIVDGAPIKLDVYRPEPSSGPCPAVVYFHGGGLTVGNRQSWFPVWLQKRLKNLGYAFISADYRLLPPATGHDILADIQDLFVFIRNELNGRLDGFHIDSNALAVAGTSAGGLCAYLAAMHVVPKPKAAICMYAMGGNFLTSQYITPKPTPFFRGRELLDTSNFMDYLYPACTLVPATSDSPLAYHPDTHPIPGYPANPRMLLSRLYLQIGTFLDYYTGEHNPSISAALRESIEAENASLNKSDPSELIQHLIPACHRVLFPLESSQWPPTYLVHGSEDSAVPVHDSYHIKNLLERSGILVRLSVAQGEEHSFDYQPDAEAKYGSSIFVPVVEFIKEYLGASPSTG